ncbi:MAG: hypothetical protein ACYSOW_10635 [Planctomycetota bacterium]|jgi:hypothetical protein
MDLAFNSVTGLPNNPLDSITNTNVNPIFLFILVGILIIFYVIFSVVGNQCNQSNVNIDQNGKNGKNGGIVFLEILLWSLFIILVLLNGIAYFFNLDIVTSLKDIFSPEPKLQIRAENYLGKNKKEEKDNQTKPIVPEKLTDQVFNIPDNVYTYPQAKALCKAFNADLATYSQIEQAYNNGAEWCNYGWSADQLALFPTNMETWKKLRKIKGHENDCGRAGVNGGFIDNPNVRFGVNCYGKKPSITGAEQLLMNNSSPFPQTVEELEQQKKVDKFKNKINNILVSPFNHNSWSQA